MQNEELRTRKNWTDEEVAQIVGGYRLTDGQQQDYAVKIGISKNALSYCVQKARMLDLRRKFPGYFGDTTKVVHDAQAENQLALAKLEIDGLLAANARLVAELDRTKRRLGKAVNMLLDD